MSNKKQELVILFDGECILCNRFINFIIKRDKKNKFKLAYLQSKYFDNLPNKPLSTQENTLDSILLVEEETIYTKSTAIIRIINKLGGSYHTISLFFIMPKFLRDLYYDFIGRRRYKWFGKKDICIANKEVQTRLIKD